MKKTTTCLMLILTLTLINAQTPEKISYQVIVRDAGNNLVINTKVKMRITILKDVENLSSVYTEMHNPVTNENGLITVAIGGGLKISGEFFTIDWSCCRHYLKTEIDPTGGTNFSIISTTQLLSVPYALYAKKAANGFSGDYNDLKNKPTTTGVWNTTGNNIFYNSGNVGIGSTNPSEKFEVNGTVKSITQNADSSNGAQFQAWTNGSKQGLKSVYSFYPTFQTTNDNDPRRAADIVSGFEGGAWGHEYLTFHVGSDQKPNDKQEITKEKMRITGEGNVGIGKANPIVKLDVNGEISVNSNKIVNVADPTENHDAATKAYVDSHGFSGNYNDLINKPANATTITNGFMSSGDKSKLEGIAMGAEINVNADWNAMSGDAQIMNKPDLLQFATKNMKNQNITNLANPVNAQDAATKAYVDNKNELNLHISSTGDTLWMNSTWLIISGISSSNDHDNDGYIGNQDCNEDDGSIHFNAEEINCDGIDQNCDGMDDCKEDKDGDGFTQEEGDCDDNNPLINPDAEEICSNQIDENCTGVDKICYNDYDGDGIIVDNCPYNYNPDQLDTNKNGIGDVCDGSLECSGASDDYNNCTIDFCNRKKGFYEHIPINCNDDDPNTTDICSPASGCQHAVK